MEPPRPTVGCYSVAEAHGSFGPLRGYMSRHLCFYELFIIAFFLILPCATYAERDPVDIYISHSSIGAKSIYIANSSIGAQALHLAQSSIGADITVGFVNNQSQANVVIKFSRSPIATQSVHFSSSSIGAEAIYFSPSSIGAKSIHITKSGYADRLIYVENYEGVSIQQLLAIMQVLGLL